MLSVLLSAPSYVSFAHRSITLLRSINHILTSEQYTAYIDVLYMLKKIPNLIFVEDFKTRDIVVRVRATPRAEKSQKLILGCSQNDS